MSDQAKEALSKKLEKQVSGFINFLEEYNQKRLVPRDTKDYTFLRDFFPRYIEDQNKRADEIDSKEYKEALELAKKQFPHKPHWVLCLDGRVLVVLGYGATADIDDSIRVPGGMLREFVRGKDGKMFLRRDSNYATLLMRSLESSTTDTVLQIFDSHLGCAARKVEESEKGKYPKDAGLLSDVHHKKQMIQAAKKFAEKEYNGKKHIIAIQTSFDPHEGFMYMGLETEKALAFATERGREFRKEILDSLVKEDLIISTEQLVAEPEILATLKAHDFDLSWKTHYVESATAFWKNVAEMKSTILPLIEQKVLKVYPHLKSEDSLFRDELESRAMLLLLNAYSGYLENNHPENGKSGDPEIHAHEDDIHHHAYSYGVHEEEGVRISEGGYPPYEISMFTIFALELTNLPANIELAVTLVRSNQKEARVKDRSGTFTDPLEFAHAPVPLAYHELVRDPHLHNADWESVITADWFDLPEIPWDTMDEEAFERYLETKGKIPLSIANGVKRLRHKMMVLYDPDHSISHHLLNQDEVVLPVLADRSRRIRCVIPFMKLGYEEQA